MYTTASLLSLAALASLASATPVAKPMPDDTHMAQWDPIHYDIPSAVNKRDVSDAFRLRDSESFYYGDANDHSRPMGNITGHFQGAHEHVINMDRFADLLQNVDCKNPNLKLAFKDKQGLESAKQSWKWVNEHKDNKFMMVANAPDCGPDDDRQPFQVTGIDYDDEKNTVNLQAHQVDWDHALPEWEVHMNTKGILDRHDAGPSKRFDSGTKFSPSLEKDFSGNIASTEVKGVNLALDCEKCGSFGNLDIEIKGRGRTFPWPKLYEASLTMTPDGLELAAILGVRADGTLTDGWDKVFPGPSGPLPYGGKLGPLRFGPNWAVEYGMGLGEWRGEAHASWGAKLHVPDDSIFKVDLANNGNNEYHGWVPEFQHVAPTFDAKVTGSVNGWVGVALTADLVLFGYGLSGGLRFQGPEVDSEFVADVGNTGSACDGSNAGVDIVVDVGGQIVGSGGIYQGKQYFSKQLVSTQVNALSKCLGLGGSEPTDDAVAAAAKVYSTVPAAAKATVTGTPVAAEAATDDTDDDGFSQVTDAPEPTMKPYNPADSRIAPYINSTNGTNGTDSNVLRGRFIPPQYQGGHAWRS